MAAEGSSRYLGGVDEPNPASDGDQFEFDEADIWNVGEIILPESSITVVPSLRKFRKPARKRADVDQFSGGSKSLPVNIPNWSKISDRDRDDDRRGEYQKTRSDRGLILPPHEYLARSRVASMSVHEGIGRTLKGRDLSNVRNAVLKKIGIED